VLAEGIGRTHVARNVDEDAVTAFLASETA
jgi:hypothetical protein